MTQVRIHQTAQALTPVSFWWRAGSAARRLVPQTREAWAALAGASVTPAVIVGLMAWAVFSHPTLTLGSLTSFVVWQIADVTTVLFSGVSTALAQGLDAFGARSLLDTLAAAPLVAAGVVLTYTMLSALALRVLYKNLFANRPARGRYSHVTLAS